MAWHINKIMITFLCKLLVLCRGVLTLSYLVLAVQILVQTFQIRKVVLVQACARGWLARRNYQRLKAQMAISVLTLQRHVRGWLTRKKLQERQRQLAREFQREQMEQENQRRHQKAGKSYQ